MLLEKDFESNAFLRNENIVQFSKAKKFKIYENKSNNILWSTQFPIIFPFWSFYNFMSIGVWALLEGIVSKDLKFTFIKKWTECIPVCKVYMYTWNEMICHRC